MSMMRLNGKCCDVARRDFSGYKADLMTSDTTETGQLSIPLGADRFWADLADEEARRDIHAAKQQADPNEVYTLIPLEEWRQEQAAQPTALPDRSLQEGRLYEIDGGVFKAMQQDGKWELWTWQGQNGNDVGTRTGFEISASGELHDRLYDVMTKETLVLNQAHFSVADLQPVLLEIMDSSAMEQDKRANESLHDAQGYI